MTGGGALLIGAAAAVFALSGCEAHVSVGDDTPKVSQSTLEAGLKEKITETAGRSPDRIACPGELEGKIGNTTECALESGGAWLPVEVKVTAVEGKTVDYDLQVGKNQIPQPSYAN
ncbi:MAG: DUF4333 domain-containing protein [Gordonia sp. (in: high G+C Gram-positive bacteria)]|uniref:DUF4333 domain-containing protein n=1 Tax=Gordonia sp. (in: high G+C Gram-positive bacteria) TaxID=84139 RepID=UPI0039E38B90